MPNHAKTACCSFIKNKSMLAFGPFPLSPTVGFLFDLFHFLTVPFFQFLGQVRLRNAFVLIGLPNVHCPPLYTVRFPRRCNELMQEQIATREVHFVQYLRMTLLLFTISQNAAAEWIGLMHVCSSLLPGIMRIYDRLSETEYSRLVRHNQYDI